MADGKRDDLNGSLVLKAYRTFFVEVSLFGVSKGLLGIPFGISHSFKSKKEKKQLKLVKTN